MSCLHYVSRLSARHGAELVVLVGGGKAAEVFPYHQDVVSTGYAAEGKSEDYKDDTVQYYGGLVSRAIMGLYRGSNPPATSFMIGPDPGTNTTMGAMSAWTGALVIGGTARTMRIGTTATFSDYMLISDEVHAAGAFLSRDPMLMGMVFSADVLKVYFVILLFLAGVLNAFGIDIFYNLLQT
jgi:hypothetical protein